MNFHTIVTLHDKCRRDSAIQLQHLHLLRMCVMFYWDTYQQTRIHTHTHIYIHTPTHMHALARTQTHPKHKLTFSNIFKPECTKCCAEACSSSSSSTTRLYPLYATACARCVCECVDTVLKHTHTHMCVLARWHTATGTHVHMCAHPVECTGGAARPQQKRRQRAFTHSYSHVSSPSPTTSVPPPSQPPQTATLICQQCERVRACAYRFLTT